MQKYLFLLLATSVIQCSDFHIKHPFGMKNSSSQSSLRLPASLSTFFGLGYLASWFFSDNKPTHSWRPGKWDTYLQQRFKDVSNDSYGYSQNLISCYELYEFEEFRFILGSLDCDDSLFFDLKNLENQSDSYSLYYCESAASQHLKSLTPAKQEEFLQYAHQILHFRHQRQERLYLQQEQELKRQEEIARKKRDVEIREEKIRHKKEIIHRMREQNTSIQALSQAYQENMLAYSYIPSDILHQRINGISNQFPKTNAPLTTQQYSLSNPAYSLLKSYNITPDLYQNHTGISLQHVVHKECVQVVEIIAHATPLNAIQPFVIDFVEAGREYNQAGFIEKAYNALDVCWSIMQCAGNVTHALANGVIEGGVNFSKNTASFLYSPVKTTKEFFSTIKKAAESVQKALEPYCYVIETGGDEPICVGLIVAGKHIENVVSSLATYAKKHPYQALQKGSSVITESYLNGKMVQALSNLFAQAKQQFPQTLKRLSENIQLLEAQDIPALVAIESAPLSIKREIEVGENLFLVEKVHNELVSIKNSSPGAVEEFCRGCLPLEELCKDLKIRQFTSIIKTTNHGLAMLIEREFTPEEVRQIVWSPSTILKQQDGSKAFIKLMSDGYGLIILNKKHKVITALKCLDEKALTNLGRNYGWK